MNFILYNIYVRSKEENFLMAGDKMNDLILLIDNLEKQFDYHYESMMSSIETIKKELDNIKKEGEQYDR